MVKYDSNVQSNIGTGSTAAFQLQGGKYGIVAIGTYGGGNQQLQVQAADASTWVSAGAAITAAGYSTQDLIPGTYRWTITTATANYLLVSRIPEG